MLLSLPTDVILLIVDALQEIHTGRLAGPPYIHRFFPNGARLKACTSSRGTFGRLDELVKHWIVYYVDVHTKTSSYVARASLSTRFRAISRRLEP